MKLHRLEMEGFGPFLGRQIVDFDAFDDDGIFLISGRTGAGKSSVLDGVCFALYGSAPRYDGVEKRLRSDHCEPGDPTEVVLEFTAADRRYRVERAPDYERPKARGEGLTVEKARAVLSVWDDGRWRGVASKLSDVGTKITDEIVGLTRDQFLQVILLAQGRFAQFLLAKNDDRQALLRTLFGSGIYRDYEALLEDRRRAATARLEAGSAELSLLLDDAEALVGEHALGADAEEDDPASAGERLERLERSVRRADYRVEQAALRRTAADDARAAADAGHRAQVALRDAQIRRAELREGLGDLEGRSGQIAADRLRLDRARAAETLRAYLDAAAASAVRETTAVGEERRAETRFTDAGGPVDADVATLRRLDDEWTGELAVAARAVESERRVADLDVQATDAEQRIAAATAGRDDHERGLVEVRERLPRIDEEIGRLSSAPQRHAELSGRADDATARVASAREAERLAEVSRDADEEYAASAREHADATAAVAALLQRRLTGMAGELADALVDGEPCAVCGAIDHPHPASGDDDRVTDDIVARAEAAVAAAGEVAQRMGAAARDVQKELARAREGAGGASVAELTEARERLLSDIDEVAGQIARRDALAAERAELAARESASVEAAASIAAEIDRVRQELATVREQAQAARAQVAVARGDHETVASRIDVLTARREAARALIAARENARRCEVDRRAAAEELDEKLGATVFADSADASGALMDDEARAVLDGGIREHERDVAAHREMLRVLEIDLAGAPEDVVDAEAARRSLADAEVERTAAIAGEATASAVAQTLRDRVTRAQSVHAASGALIDEHRRITALADAVAGRNTRKMDLETFVLAAELEQIVTAANRRLDEMSEGRYRLRHTDAVTARGSNGLGLEVLDAFTAQARPPQSLSGGETFLASLALALGLAETVTARAGGLRLDTLFVDEGFGSLDAETLEAAMRTIDELRQGGRTVGLISHVEAMREQIPAQVQVRARPHGPSDISQPAPAAV